MRRKSLVIMYVLSMVFGLILLNLAHNQNIRDTIQMREEALNNHFHIVEYILKIEGKSNLESSLTTLTQSTGYYYAIYDRNHTAVFTSPDQSFVSALEVSLNSTTDQFGFYYQDFDDSKLLSSVQLVEVDGEEYYVQISELFDIPLSTTLIIQFGVALFLLTTALIILLRIDTIQHKSYIEKINRNLEDIVDNKPLIPEKELFDIEPHIKRVRDSISEINEKYDYHKSQLVAILGSLNLGLVAMKPNGEVIFANRKANDLFGFMLDGPKINIYNTTFDNHVLKVLEQTSEKDVVELKYVEQRNGLIFNYSGICIISQEKRVGTLVVIEDVTKIVELDKMKSDFISNVTHELKTPLTSIQGFSETLQVLDPNNSKFNDFLQIINKEAIRLNDLIQDILILSDVESRVEIDPKWIDINRVSREVIDLLSIQKKPDVELSIEATKNYLVLFDRYQLKQLLLNLVNNALKYTDQGFVKVQISDGPKSTVLKVVDSGIGIPQEEQGRIFERFYRVNKDRSRRTGGTGLGLSIVKHIVESNGCQLHVQSQEGEGTTIRIEFPKEET